MRVAFTQGLPPQTLGSIVMRSNSAFMVEILYLSYHGRTGMFALRCVAPSRASPRCAEDRQTVSPLITPAASHPFDHGGLKRPRTDNRRGFRPGREREEAHRPDSVEFS